MPHKRRGGEKARRRRENRRNGEPAERIPPVPEPARPRGGLLECSGCEWNGDSGYPYHSPASHQSYATFPDYLSASNGRPEARK